MPRVVTDCDARAEMRSALDEIVLDGARRMLAAALEVEVDAYIAGLADERDQRGRRHAVPLPEDPLRAWDTWHGAGVAQFHQPHNLFPPFRQILDDELPGTVDDLVDAGCVRLDPLEWMPPFIHDRAPRPGDDRFRYVTGRRPVLEWVLARRTERQDGVIVRRGVGAAGLVTAAGALEGVPHVTGVQTTTGERLESDLLVDAMGRRSPMGRWLAHIGARPPCVEAEQWRFV